MGDWISVVGIETVRSARSVVTHWSERCGRFMDLILRRVFAAMLGWTRSESAPVENLFLSW